MAKYYQRLKFKSLKYINTYKKWQKYKRYY